MLVQVYLSTHLRKAKSHVFGYVLDGTYGTPGKLSLYVVTVWHVRCVCCVCCICFVCVSVLYDTCVYYVCNVSYACYALNVWSVGNSM